jgi:hypothetical protein
MFQRFFLKKAGLETRAKASRFLPRPLLSWALSGAFLLSFLFAGSRPARAGMVPLMNLVRFSEPGSYSLGFDAEAQLSEGSGVGGNLRLNHGLSELSNLNAFFGTGSGGRSVRFGGNLSFDFFPDVDAQPGIGVALQVSYARIRPLDERGLISAASKQGRLDIGAIPYVHKAFGLPGGESIDPYLAIPFGLFFSDGRYVGTSALTVGALFSGPGGSNGRIFYNLEMGIGLNRSATTLSGGLMARVF